MGNEKAIAFLGEVFYDDKIGPFLKNKLSLSISLFL